MLKKFIIVAVATLGFFAMEVVFGTEAVRNAEHRWIYLILMLLFFSDGEKK